MNPASRQARTAMSWYPDKSTHIVQPDHDPLSRLQVVEYDTATPNTHISSVTPRQRCDAVFLALCASLDGWDKRLLLSVAGHVRR